MIAIGCEETPSLLIIIHVIKIIEFSGLRVLEVYIRIAYGILLGIEFPDPHENISSEKAR
jgi:hypothetical protein